MGKELRNKEETGYSPIARIRPFVQTNLARHACVLTVESVDSILLSLNNDHHFPMKQTVQRVFFFGGCLCGWKKSS